MKLLDFNFSLNKVQLEIDRQISYGLKRREEFEFSPKSGESMCFGIRIFSFSFDLRRTHTKLKGKRDFRGLAKGEVRGREKLEGIGERNSSQYYKMQFHIWSQSVQYISGQGAHNV